ncbi:MAG: hypothetical protein JMN26_17440 [gamma proteobacterium endosymbiont of Lamellibrachia anaximandri]|nr:hypothetical protein [gamma proteobacterium endosymbiont of Lamellibrachia anaximandri]
MLKNNITHKLKTIGLSCLLPVVLLAPSGLVAAEDYAGSLTELVKNSGKAGTDELCLLANRVSDIAAPAGVVDQLKRFKDRVNSSFFSESVYCDKNIINIALQTAEEADLAIVQTSETLHSALIALDYKEEDLRDLARIKKANLGTSFTKKALGNVENNSKVVEKWSIELSKAITKRQNSPLGQDAKEEFAKAVGNLRGAFFHQAKALIGIYLLKEYAVTAPKAELATLVVHSKRVGLPEDFWSKALPRLAGAIGNVFKSGQAGLATDQVIDDSEWEAIVNTTSDAAIIQARKESVAAAKQIEGKSSFAGLPSDKDQIKLADKQNDSDLQESGTSTSLAPDLGISNAVDAAKALWPW